MTTNEPPHPTVRMRAIEGIVMIAQDRGTVTIGRVVRAVSSPCRTV